MLGFSTRDDVYNFYCPGCGKEIINVVPNKKMGNYNSLERRCPDCNERLVKRAGKVPQIVVSVVGSKKCDTKGFIASAVYKMRESQNGLWIGSISETSSLMLGKTKIVLKDDKASIEGVWNFEKIEKAYKNYYEDENAQYPIFESEDPYDRAYIQSYTFEIINTRNDSNVLLTIVEINERFLYRSRYFRDMRMMQDEFRDVKRILKHSGYVFFLLDPDDIKDPSIVEGVTLFKDAMGEDASYAIICNNKPEKVYMSCDGLEANKMEALLNANRQFVNGKIRLSKSDKLRNKKCLYFMCSPKEHSDNDEKKYSLNCELPFYWVLILEGTMDVLASEGNVTVSVNRIKSNAYWNKVEEKLYFLD